MLFSLRELVQWLGFATFELFLHLLALLVFSMLVALRADMFTPTLSWWLVFVPLFAADGLSTYFTAIVSIRLYQENEKRLAVLRLLWVMTVLSLKLVCEVLLCQKLAEQEQARDLWFGLIVSPLFILLQLLMIRACRVNWGDGDEVCDFASPNNAGTVERFSAAVRDFVYFAGPDKSLDLFPPFSIAHSGAFSAQIFFFSRACKYILQSLKYTICNCFLCILSGSIERHRCNKEVILTTTAQVSCTFKCLKPLRRE